MDSIINDTPKGTSFRANTSYDVYRSLRSLYPFCTANHFTQSPESYALQCFLVDQIPAKLPLYVWRSRPHLSCMPHCAHPRWHPKLHLDRFSRFCSAHDRERPGYSVCSNRPHL